jgi:hypothetical protein
MSGNGQVIAEIAAPEADLKAFWAQIPEITNFEITAAEGEYCRCALTPREGVDLRSHIYALVTQRGWYLRELTRNRYSLEDIYVQITQPEEEEEEL